MTDVVTFLEAIFSLTAPCHLDGAQRSAALMLSVMEQAISRLRDLPDRGVTDENSIRTLDEAMAILLKSCEENAHKMTALLANADREILALQDLLVEFAS
ncbi:hypothetical protein [Burkholderia glumae]|uniref:Uncharacterized protein n=2 Tax=Burkholderia glumae TaxID=337 RepID=A0ABY5BD05_BURGL|nr:hypothetical protein [Burkholderia glumae]MCM2495980.1 hypothetical protein [Burkholderia glumae]MCM2547327.1 hypothetical protein [Burkholderia glumae]USS44304.1 hypothetical protein NFI99_13555 [Burkholderia glumae]